MSLQARLATDISTPMQCVKRHLPTKRFNVNIARTQNESSNGRAEAVLNMSIRSLKVQVLQLWGLYGILGIMEKKMETTIMENQMDKKMENEMETREYIQGRASKCLDSVASKSLQACTSAQKCRSISLRAWACRRARLTAKSGGSRTKGSRYIQLKR